VDLTAVAPDMILTSAIEAGIGIVVFSFLPLLLATIGIAEVLIWRNRT
jgi:hypothetical protein